MNFTKGTYEMITNVRFCLLYYHQMLQMENLIEVVISYEF